jgi:CRISPR-associated protein Cas2
MKRQFYLVSYDIACPHRLASVLKTTQSYRVEGQKSMHECWLSPAELQSFRSTLCQLIHPDEDRIHIMLLDPRMTVQVWGTGTTFIQQNFFMIV